MTEARSRPCITIDPCVMDGEPCISWRLTAEQFAGVWWRGNYSLGEIIINWPGVRREDVQIACWYMARFGSRTWRKRWDRWATEWRTPIWHGDWDNVPMPPQKEGEE